jgi:magnesium transporter
MSEAKRQFETISSNGVLWINIQRPTFADINALGQKYPFHKLNLEDCLSKIQIPKIDRYENHIFAILHFPTPDKEKGFLFSQLAIFMGYDYLVTIHQGDLKALEELFNMCKNDEKQQQQQQQAIMGKSSGYLLHKIIDTLVDDLLHILMKVVGNIDDIEDSVFNERISIPRQISLLRREITTLRRVVIPLRRTVVDCQRMSSVFQGRILLHISKTFRIILKRYTKLWKRQKKQSRSIRTRTICSAKKKPTKYWLCSQ